MKAKLLSLFIALIVIGCGDGTVDYDDLEYRNRVAYLPNEETPFTGRVESLHGNGQKRCEANYKNGKLDGLETFWYESGQMRSENNYKDGIYEGVSTDWYENGQKKREINFKDRKQNGRWTWWHENGQKQEEVNYRDGRPYGLWTKWYENGKKKEEGNLKGDKRDGLSTDWYESGQKRQESNWKDGKLMSVVAWKPNGQKCPATNVKYGNGLKVGYYENGQKKVEANWKDGIVDGPQAFWYKNGQKAYESKSKGNKCMSAVTWKPNGDKCPMTNLSDGNGVWVWYNENGKEQARASYKGGEPVDYLSSPDP